MSLSSELRDRITVLVRSNPVVLFMKGNGGEPARLAELYRRAMQLELAFFQAAWEAA